MYSTPMLGTVSLLWMDGHGWMYLPVLVFSFFSTCDAMLQSVKSSAAQSATESQYTGAADEYNPGMTYYEDSEEERVVSPD